MSLENANEVTADIARSLASNLFIYPITPSTNASEAVSPDAYQMNSELASIAAVHGAGHYTQRPAATFTSSEGFMLMLPSIYKMVGERVPAVIHVASRQVANNSLSIKCDHSDFELSHEFYPFAVHSINAQDCAADALAAYMLAAKAKIPVIHYYDGFLTSHESIKTKIGDYEKIYQEFCSSLPKDPEDRAIGFISDTNLTFELTKQLALKNDEIPEDFECVRGFLSSKGVLVEPFVTKCSSEERQKVQNIILTVGSSFDILSYAFSRDPSVECIGIKELKPFPVDQLNNLLRHYPNLKNITVMNRTFATQKGDEYLTEEMRKLKTSKKLISGVYGIGGRELTIADCQSIVKNARGAGKYSFTVGCADDVSGQEISDYYVNSGLDTCPFKAKLDKSAFTINTFGLGSGGHTSASAVSGQILSKFYSFAATNAYFDAKKSNGLARGEIRLGGSFQPPDEPGIIGIGDARLLSTFSGDVEQKLALNGFFLINGGQEERQLAREKLEGRTYFVDLMPICGKNKENFHFQYALGLCLEKEKLIEKKQLTELQEELALQIEKFSHVAKSEAIFELRAVENAISQAETLNGTPDEPKLAPTKMTELSSANYLPHASNRSEKRNVSALAPQWASDKCIECGKCTMFCPHGVIEPYLLTNEEYQEYLQRGGQKTNENIGKYHYVIQASPLDCTGCGICASHCPTAALSMQTHGKHEENMFEFLSTIEGKKDYDKRLPSAANYTEKALQFTPQSLKYHAACPGCGESGYLELICKLMKINNRKLAIVEATGCPLIYCGEYKSQPFSDGFWTNSLFEDSAEVAFGYAEASKQPVWCVMGDGAAYDIGFNGLDFVCRQRENVKVLILDNNGYANTGGQKSSATPELTKTKTGQEAKQKDIARLLMQYNNAYIASVSGHETKRTMQILQKALEYDGPAVVIAYSPCVLHTGHSALDCIDKEQKAVECGLNLLLEFDPRRAPGERLKIESEKTTTVGTMGEERFVDVDGLDRIISERIQDMRRLEKVM